jgi:hypothetical protein
MLLFAEDGGQQHHGMVPESFCRHHLVVSEGKHEEEGCQLLDVSTYSIILHERLKYVYGTNSTYEHSHCSHMPKINSSSVKICESSRPRLPASRPRLAQKFSIEWS